MIKLFLILFFVSLIISIISIAFLNFIACGISLILAGIFLIIYVLKDETNWRT